MILQPQLTPISVKKISLQASCSQLKGVGPHLTAALKGLDIHTIQDILFHLPLRYQDRTRLVPIRAACVGHEVLIHGTVTNQQLLYKPRTQLILQLSDGSGICHIRLFHFSNQQKAALKIGTHLHCFAEVRLGRFGLEMIHPEYQIVANLEHVSAESTLTPVYPTTEGVGQNTWRRLTDQALAILSTANDLAELLPVSLRERLALPDLREAIYFVHRPSPQVNIAELMAGKHPMQRRLAFEELLAHQLSLRLIRQQIQANQAPAFMKTSC